MAQLVPTLSGSDYTSADVFTRERERIFHGGWFMALRADTLEPGNRRVVDVAGESVLIARALDGTIYAHANVCRHRGARLCETDSTSRQGSIMCPYHAWTYALDGTLIATPHLSDDEVPKAELSLWSIHTHEWHGFVFVSLASTPPAFDTWMQTYCSELEALERFHLGDLAVAVRTTTVVQANWKILFENYQECLHCTRVHPELVDIVPLYRTGAVSDPDRTDGGVQLMGNSFSQSGTSHLPLLPGVAGDDEHSYFGASALPNLFVDITGTSVIVSILHPNSPTQTTVHTEYLFAPSTIAAQGFDPAEVVDFSELVAAQDYAVCEMVQRGVASSKFTHGMLSPKDELVVSFLGRYRMALGAEHA